jgi:hypothetical protein
MTSMPRVRGIMSKVERDARISRHWRSFRSWLNYHIRWTSKHWGYSAASSRKLCGSYVFVHDLVTTPVGTREVVPRVQGVPLGMSRRSFSMPTGGARVFPNGFRLVTLVEFPMGITVTIGVPSRFVQALRTTTKNENKTNENMCQCVRTMISDWD